jgi:hypothetical protein
MTESTASSQRSAARSRSMALGSFGLAEKLKSSKVAWASNLALAQAPGQAADSERQRLRLDPRVAVDISQLTDLAQRVVLAPDDGSLAQAHVLVDHVAPLPDWDDCQSRDGPAFGAVVVKISTTSPFSSLRCRVTSGALTRRRCSGVDLGDYCDAVDREHISHPAQQRQRSRGFSRARSSIIRTFSLQPALEVWPTRSASAPMNDALSSPARPGSATR